MVSLPHEMQRYVKSDDIKDETLVNPDKAQLDNPQKMNPNFSRLFNRHAWSDDPAFGDLAAAVFDSLSSDSKEKLIGKSNNKGSVSPQTILKVLLVKQ